jgi:hypothetical protein
MTVGNDSCSGLTKRDIPHPPDPCFPVFRNDDYTFSNGICYKNGLEFGEIISITEGCPIIVKVRYTAENVYMKGLIYEFIVRSKTD